MTATVRRRSAPAGARPGAAAGDRRQPVCSPAPDPVGPASRAALRPRPQAAPASGPRGRPPALAGGCEAPQIVDVLLDEEPGEILIGEHAARVRL